MLAKVEPEKPGNGLLKELEVLSESLYLNANRPPKDKSSTSKGRSKSAGKAHCPEQKSERSSVKEDYSEKEKKSSIWDWKPWKALSNMRSRRINCLFSLQVHAIEGLPPSFNDINLCVYWKRKDETLQTSPIRVFQGVAEFEEILTYKCSVNVSGNGPHNSAKYDSKHFLLHASIFGVPDIDLGKHRVDFTRILPLTLEELEEERCLGKWTTSFKLSGKAKGATMNVSLGFSVIRDVQVPSGSTRNYPENQKLFRNITSSVNLATADQSDISLKVSLRRFGSVPDFANQWSRIPSQSMDDVKILHEILPSSRSELASSVNILYQKFDEGKLDSLDDCKPVFEASSEHVEPPGASPETYFELSNNENECKDTEFTVVEMSTEKSDESSIELDEEARKAVNVSAVETPELPEIDESYKVALENVNKLHPQDEASGSNQEVNPDSFFEPPEENDENECEDTEFTVVEKGIEMPDECPIEVDEEARKDCDVSVVTTELPGIDDNYEVALDEYTEPHHQDEACTSNQEVFDYDSKENSIFSKESIMEELDSTLHSLSVSDPGGLNSPQRKSDSTELADHMEVESNYKAEKMGKSLSLDDAIESVASEFLTMLGIEHSPFGTSSDSDPDSPRERLLRQFEKETLNGGNCILGFDMSEGEEAELCYDVSSGSSLGDLSQDFELSSAIQAAETEVQITTQAISSKTRAKMLEDMETEALMREWGLNEGAFQSSPPDNASGFGSPIDLPPQVPLELPPLGEGLGPYLQTKEGGFLRSMNPLLFKNAKNSGSLIMQVSSPIVLPAEMGSGIMEILQCLASVGIEKLSMQANKLMPLEDITAKTMHQVAWEAATCNLKAEERQAFLLHELEIMQDKFVGRKKNKGDTSGHKSNNLGSGALSTDSVPEYVSLEDLAPLAMDKIETLCIEGLRIQCGMSDEDAPSNICPQSIGEMSALEGKRANNGGSLGLEGAAGLQLLDIKDGADDIDGLMGLSITLDEWMRLDSGVVDEDQISERTSKVLAAHHSKDLITGGRKGDKKQGKGSSKTFGLLGNNFTVALMVQLRDPLRNYDPVGTPMLALVQVERVFVPPKPKIYSTVSENRIKSEEDDESELLVKQVIKDEHSDSRDGEEGVPHFKITEVHVAGLKNDPNKRKLWGTKTQQQSGSRWLAATGMGKSNKHPILKSKAVAKPSPQVTTKVQPGDTLWSISSRVHGNGAKWKELAALNPHIRNPNVILPNETIRLR